MAELKETYRKVYDELQGVGIKMFSRSHCLRKRYFFMITNIVESMNSCLVAFQKLPITKMAECIRDLLQRWFYDRQTNEREMSTYLTAFTEGHIKDRTDTAQRCEIHLFHFNKFKVDDKWKATTINLDDRSCSCRKWDLDDLSCSHAMEVARFKGMLINSLVSDLYTTGFLKHAYEIGVNPILDPKFQNIPDVIRNRIVLPWEKINLPRGPKKLWISSAGEKRKLHSCSKCGKKGHKKNTCPEPSSSTNKPAKKTRSYNICKKDGHNRLRCLDKPPEPILIDMDEQKVDGPPVI
ncbi:hypothetical protein Ddye_008471 [Dipteronia dyeriana]|uniref:SWIM-type domain-containing protein n=1 Tax=Dipteronia dyeriana TaxID=168575 RepID=A0AAE0CLE2_9ROSI|nr:hypothetical protein Ddye_008471 [Dipteronia dyeriana]